MLFQSFLELAFNFIIFDTWVGIIINIIISSSIMEFLVTQKFLKKQMLKKISYRKNNKTQQRDSARNRNLTRGS